MAARDLIITEWQSRGDKEFEGRLDRIGGKVDGVESRLGKFSNALSLIGGISAGAGLIKFGKDSLSAAGDVEATRATLEALTKSATETNAIIKQIDAESLTSVFQKSDLSEASTLLSAYRLNIQKYLPLADDLAAAFRSQGVTIQDTSRAFGRLASGDFGEAFERLRDFGISRKDLEAQGLKFDRSGSYTGSVDDAMKAVDKIVTDRFSGISEKLATGTLTGAVSNFGDAIQRLETTAGDLVLPQATAFIKQITAATGALNDFAKIHPTAFKAGIGIVGTGVAAITAGKAYGFAKDGLSQFGDLVGLVTGKSKKAAAAKGLLEKATRGDAVAELAKSKIAGIEGDAIEAGAEKALGAAGAKAKLGIETEKAAEKLTALGRVQSLLSKPIALGGVESTVGGVAAGAAIGAVSGYEFHNAAKYYGASDTTANAIGGGGGLAVAALTILAPEVALPVAAAVAIGEGIKYAADKWLVEPAVKAGEQSNGLTPEAQTAAGSDYNAQADALDKLAAAKEKEANNISTTLDFYGDDRARQAELRTEAKTFRLTAAARRKEVKKQGEVGTEEWRQQYLAKQDQFMKDHPFVTDPNQIAQRQADLRSQGEAAYRSASPEQRMAIANESRRRDGTITLQIKPGPGDNMARQANFNRRTVKV